MIDDLVPDQASIYQWIEEIYGWGIRRPGYAADRKAEQFLVDQFERLGLEKVRKEPVKLPYWEPMESSLIVKTDSERFEIPCFPLPHSQSVDGLELPLIKFDAANPADAKGMAVLHSMPLLRLPPTLIADAANAMAELQEDIDLKLTLGGFVIDPRGTFKDSLQVLPFPAVIQAVMEPAIAADAGAFIGVLSDYPGDSYQYYVPYDAIKRDMPGVWIRGSDGARLQSLLADGEAQVTLTVKAKREEITCYNIIGELAGADEETVVIGSHHDGPWASAVEDASGISLVLAQAHYWSSVPRQKRPHRLVFLVNAGHMAGGAGCEAYIEQHQDDLDSIVLELHLEHAANEMIASDDGLVASGEPETRWFFTSQSPSLKQAVVNALQTEALDRSLVIAPNAFGDRPTTDGGAFYLAGVPLVNYLTAPFYLFDAMDTLDKIHRPSLEAITRWTIRMVDYTTGISARQMRQGMVQ